MELIYTYENGDQIHYEKSGFDTGGFCDIVDKDYNLIEGAIFGHTKKVAIERAREIRKNLKQ